jgi:hypothetical protein
VVVNETPDATRRRLRVEGRTLEVPVAALGARLALFERGSGKLIALSPGEALPN